MPDLIDINCDVGEGIGNEQDLMPFITSCNIACGGHAGDNSTMHRTLLLAKRHGVRAGFHPSYPDRQNFGRQVVDMGLVELRKSLTHQVNTLLSIAHQLEVSVKHIKLHGALYNEAAKDMDLAQMVVELILKVDPNLILYTLPDSVLYLQAVNAGIEVWGEGFADRNYQDDLTLVPRDNFGAIVESGQVLAHVRHMVEKQSVITQSGSNKKLVCKTICIHGDNPDAVYIANTLYQEFINH